MFNFAFVIVFIVLVFFFTLLIYGVIRVTSCLSVLAYPPWEQKLFKVLLVEPLKSILCKYQSKLSLVVTLGRQEVHNLLTFFN